MFSKCKKTQKTFLKNIVKLNFCSCKKWFSPIQKLKQVFKNKKLQEKPVKNQKFENRVPTFETWNSILSETNYLIPLLCMFL